MKSIFFLIGILFSLNYALGAAPEAGTALDAGLVNPIHGAIDYVSTGTYLRQPSFQRYLQERRAALEARGLEVDLMD